MTFVQAAVHLDRAVDAWVIAHRVAVLNPIMIALSEFGVGALGWLIVGVALTLLKRCPRLALLQLVLVLICTSVIVNGVLKPAIGRQRPWQRTSALEVIGVRAGGASFPSGHASAAGAGALVLSAVEPAAAWLWWTLALAIGYSRIYLGDHYPLDVLAGGAIGAAVAWAMRWGIRALARERPACVD
jgi:undecaprenyl-diphosphatase